MTLAQLEARVQRLEDIEAIKKLQRSYNYYLEHWQEEEVIPLFTTSPDVTVEVGETGLYKGPEGVKKFFKFSNHFVKDAPKATPEFLHVLMPIAGIVDIDPNGKTAKGRWYGWGCNAIPMMGTVKALFLSGIWENEYVKEDGVWKFKKIWFFTIFETPYEDGWVKTPRLARERPKDLPPSSPKNVFAPYPSGYQFPYHYKNPVTGK
jgi:hypothetical protein